MTALDLCYKPDVDIFNQSYSVVRVTLEGGEVIDFRRSSQFTFPALLNHQAVLTVRHTPGSLWNDSQVVAGIKQVLGSTPGKIVALYLALEAAEFWAKTQACDWISGDNGAVVWLQLMPPVPGLSFHISPPRLVRYPGEAAPPVCAAIAADLADGQVQVGGATINVSPHALNSLAKGGAKAQKAYGAMVRRGWVKG